jgi:hypothetical protein
LDEVDEAKDIEIEERRKKLEKSWQKKKLLQESSETRFSSS